MYCFSLLNQVCEKGQSQAWQRIWLDSEKAWYMTNGDQWITYEDVDSAALKVKFYAYKYSIDYIHIRTYMFMHINSKIYANEHLLVMTNLIFDKVYMCVFVVSLML